MRSPGPLPIATSSAFECCNRIGSTRLLQLFSPLASEDSQVLGLLPKLRPSTLANCIDRLRPGPAESLRLTEEKALSIRERLRWMPDGNARYISAAHAAIATEQGSRLTVASISLHRAQSHIGVRCVENRSGAGAGRETYFLSPVQQA